MEFPPARIAISSAAWDVGAVGARPTSQRAIGTQDVFVLGGATNWTLSIERSEGACQVSMLNYTFTEK